jgi:hypothetical protein
LGERDPPGMQALHTHYRRLRFGPPGSTDARGRRLDRSWWWHTDPVYRGLRAFGETVSVHPRKVRQLFQVPLFAAQFRVDPQAYYQYRLYDRWARRRDYVFHDEIVVLLNALNARLSPQDTAELSDKRLFHDRCVSARLPAIPIIAAFERGARCGEMPADPRRDLFAKFANRYCGEGASSWRYRDGAYTSGGATEDFRGLMTRLARTSIEYPVIVQPRIDNHEALVPISGRGLSTARVITLRWPGGEPQVVLASYRMPVGNLVADNFAAGGLACGIDLETGALQPARRKTDDTKLRAHPDTGAPIEGCVLPHWPDVLDLAEAAHECFGSMVSVGWDIAITPQGPVLVEGNPVWCVDLAQMSNDRPLADTPIPACLIAHLEACSRGSVPPGAA